MTDFPACRQLINNMDCENCLNYEYDEEYEDYVCSVNMDEDEYIRFLREKKCPYFRFGDEYSIVKKQN